YGLSFHGWFTPLRLGATDKMNATSSKWLTKQWYQNKKGDYVVQVGSYWYLNPAYSQTRQLIINGAVEIMQKYKVDALHIDDYFYPTTAASFDATAYKALGGGKTLKAWRTENINTLIRGIYLGIKAKNSKIRFGISPAGNIDNCVNDLYADVTLWGKQSGYMDYCMPQIYFGYKHNKLDYLKCLNRWKTTVTSSSVQLIPGLAAYKIGTANDGGSNEWATDTTILQRQVTDAKSVLGSKYGGFAIFDYEDFFKTAALNTAQRNNLAKVIK
ncbi:MAG: family 10 glycosylhydrolase, partial [Oscillospiraceae bacterium]|nr:family 10 glycosylhydrolase [Candidatus Equicaccousia limihippi]